MSDTDTAQPTATEIRYESAAIPVLRRALLHDADRNETRAGEHCQPGDAGFQDPVRLAAWSGLVLAASSGRMVAALLGLLDGPGVPAAVRERGRSLVGQVLDGWPEGIDGTNDELDRAEAAPDGTNVLAEMAAFDAETLAKRLDYTTAVNGIRTLRDRGEGAAAEALRLLAAQHEALSRKAERLQIALNAANAMNGVHQRTIARLREQLEQARLAPGPTGLARVWSGYDDDECWHPQFANLADAKAYAEAAFRASCEALGAGDPGEITWEERAARTDKTGYPDMFDLRSEVGGDGWVVCGVLVHPDLASGLRAQPIETVESDESGAVPEPQIPGQGALPVGESAQAPAAHGFRVGDQVEITAREGETGATPPGLRLNGRTGYVAEIDDNSEYSIGVTVDGWLGPVWCNSSEIRHADAAESAVVR